MRNYCKYIRYYLINIYCQLLEIWEHFFDFSCGDSEVFFVQVCKYIFAEWGRPFSRYAYSERPFLLRPIRALCRQCPDYQAPKNEAKPAGTANTTTLTPAAEPSNGEPPPAASTSGETPIGRNTNETGEQAVPGTSTSSAQGKLNSNAKFHWPRRTSHTSHLQNLYWSYKFFFRNNK